jgi:hypothetical protein
MEATVNIDNTARLLRRRLQRKYVLRFIRRKRPADNSPEFIGGPP